MRGWGSILAAAQGTDGLTLTLRDDLRNPTTNRLRFLPAHGKKQWRGLERKCVHRALTSARRCVRSFLEHHFIYSSQKPYEVKRDHPNYTKTMMVRKLKLLNLSQIP